MTENEWIKLVSDGHSTFFESNVTLDDMWIPNSLLDQIRREAQKELLDVLTPLIMTHIKDTLISFERVSGQLTHDELQKYNNSVELIEYELEKERAKTLGEKK
jgi:hypothetical protein